MNTKKSKRYYIAYGSNLHTGQMGYRCPEALAVGTSWVHGYRLLYKGSKTGAYLTIEKAPQKKVPVVVWEVSAADEASLDIYEGCPSFYYKREFNLDVETFFDGEHLSIRCFAYIMHEDRPFGIPRSAYIATCSEGYLGFGLPPAYLDQALLDTIEEVNKNGHRKVNV